MAGATGGCGDEVEVEVEVDVEVDVEAFFEVAHDVALEGEVEFERLMVDGIGASEDMETQSIDFDNSCDMNSMNVEVCSIYSL
jgi:hypothetical protein